ncbi:MAG: tetratricopeptide repeat protein [Planctomycetota bacterium]
MSLSARRRRRRQRLALLGGIFLLIAGGVTARYLVVRGDAGPTADDLRQTGMTAYQAGDYAAAITPLDDYVAQHDQDVQALFALGDAHRQLARNDTDLVTAVGRLRQALRIDPSHEPASRALLSLLLDNPQGVDAEGVKLADRLLRTAPDDAELLRARAVFLPGTGRLDQALQATLRHLENTPRDLTMQRQALTLMQGLNQNDTALLSRAAALQEAHPGDPVFTLVQAHALLLTRGPEAAAELLADDALYTLETREDLDQWIELLDAAGRFSASYATLEKLYAQEHPAFPRDELIRRRFEKNKPDLALTLLNEPAERPRWQNILATLAHLRQGDRDAAARTAAVIAQEPGVQAAAVAELLRVAALPDVTADALVEAGRQADTVRVADAYLDVLVAQALVQTDQTDAAIRRYTDALGRRPAWAEPCFELSALELARGDAAAATRYAVAGIRRRPESLVGRIQLAAALSHEPLKLTPEQRDRALQLIGEIQAARPGEPRTLVMQIDLLQAQGDRSAAERAVERALDLDPPLTEAGLLSLLRVVQRQDLAAAAIQDAYAQRFGQTLPITMLRATRLAQAGDPDAALALFHNARPAEPDPAWDINHAILLERLGDPDAAAAWAAVATAWPENLDVQRGVLASGAGWSDRDLIDQTISRIQNLAGQQDPTWRVARARWLLSSDDPVAAAPQADPLLEAALTLDPDALDALLLRSESQRLMGRPRLATALAQQAVTQSPRSARARVALAYAQRDAGSRDTALETARTATALPRASAHTLRRAAQLLIEEGRYADAADALVKLESRGIASARDLFSLAQLYQRTRRIPQAVALLDRLLAEPTAESVAFAADLYTRSGRADLADRTLGLLETLDLTDAQRKTARADHAARHGSTEEADALLLAAAQANPQDPAAWSRLVGYRLRTGRPSQAVAAAQQGRQTLTDDPGLAAVAAQATLIERQLNHPGGPALALALLLDPAHRDAAAAALRVLDETQPGSPARADRLVALADDTPGFEAAQGLAVAAELGVGRVEPALTRAAQTMQRFERSAAAAQVAAQAYAAAGRWREALGAAEAWSGRLSGGDPLAADTLTARAYRMLGRPGEALSALDAHQTALTAEPTARPEAAMELALAYAGSGRTAQAKSLLEPQLSRGVAWRLTWMDAAVTSVPGTREAGRWLERVEDDIPQASRGEHEALAQAWWAVGQRDSFRPFTQRGADRARTLAQRDDAGPGLLFFVGKISELDGHPEDAERYYRRAIAGDADAPGPRNNLAMVLADHGGSLEEAEALARRAVALDPLDPNYLDTLAHVLLKAGQPARAREAIDRAIELDPGNPLWRSRLNDMSAAVD